jgi:signal transduction histidine kinase
MLVRLDYAFTSQKNLFEDLSHELKTPLTILKGEFEVVLKKMRSPEDYAATLRSSLEEVNKMTKLVENLLMLASFESKNIMPEKKILDLGLIVQSVVNNIKALAQTKEIELTFSGKEGVSVIGDEKQLKQLFLNIVDNAVKYTPEKGLVNVSVGSDGKNAVVTVKDTGVGIPKIDLENIFKRFYRVKSVKSSRGFGLGLSIVKSIVDAHKGHIKVESVLQKGTTFTITLPQ